MKKIFLFFCLVLCFCSLSIFGGSYVPREDMQITIICGEHKVCWSDEEIGDLKVFDHQFSLQKNGRQKGFEERVALLDKILLMGFSQKDAVTYLFPNLCKKIDKMAEKVDKKEKDATLKFTPNKSKKFAYAKEQNGQFLDKNELYQKICQNLRKSGNIEIRVEPKVVRPKITKNSLIERTKLVSCFETDYSHSTENRKNNIKLALKAFDGLVLEPNKTYSFNEITGRRTKEKGYKEANIIINNEYVEGFGGGVCQVSSTLYNALLLADITVLESHPHSLESSYVMAGFDAMVNFGSSDLRFVNTKDYPQYVHAYYNNEKIGFQIYAKELPYKISRKNEVLEETKLEDVIVEDGTMLLGERQYKTLPKVGKKIKSYLEYSKNGKVVKTKGVRTQTYKPVQGVLLVGTKKGDLKEENQTFSHFQTIN